jgi:hypothetical protein
MKKLVFLAALFCLACMVLGCGSSKKPPHIQIPQYPDAFVAVGAAEVNEGSIRLIRQQAELDGRQGIARMISTRVQELLKSWGEQNQSSLYDKAAFNDYFESVGRAISDQQLSGSRVVESYYDEKTDTQYAVVIYKREDAANLAKDQMEKERKKVEEAEQEKRLFTSREEAERAFKELDALIEKELGPQ